MSWAIQALAFLFLLAGVLFVLAAAIGVWRFPDALQRMHASTKAGTLGAVLVLAGTMLVLDADAVPVGVLAILFMLLTVPVAAHLLGRAAYLSGAQLRLVVGRDALYGVLQRQQVPLEQRTEFVAYMAPHPASPPSEEPGPLGPISEVRLGVIAPDIGQPLRRALSIRAANKVPLKAVAVVDESYLSATGDTQAARLKVRAKLSQAIEEMEDLLPKRRSFFSLSYEEGDPMALIPSRDDRAALLVLPNQGWCDHGAGLPTPLATGRPEGLLRLADHHAGSLLYVGRKALARAPLVLVEDDGSEAILAGLEWALASRIWQDGRLHLVSRRPDDRHRQFRDLAARYGLEIAPAPTRLGPEDPLPADLAQADALVTTALPSPRRADWYGASWLDCIAPGWAGEVLVVPPAGKNR